MKVSKNYLQEILETVKPGLNNNNLVIEQSSSFAFINSCAVTYNDEISISCPIDNFKIEGAIKADELYNYIKKLKKDELEIIQEKKQIQIKSGRSKVGLVFETEIKLPLKIIKCKKKWNKIPNAKLFVEHLKFAMGGCGHDNAYPIYTCVHITKKGIIESSDNLRIVNCDLKKKLPITKSLLIPANNIRELIKLEPVEMTDKKKGWIHFRNKKNVIISCRTFEGEFPNTNKSLKFPKNKKIIFPDRIVEALEKAKVFAKRDDLLTEMVNIKIVDNKIEINSKSEIGSWFKEPIIFKDGTIENRLDFEFTIIPYLIMDILKQTKEAYITENNDMLMFENKEKNWRYVTLLVIK